jgi:cytochrome c-type biogenesis protein CcmH
MKSLLMLLALLPGLAFALDVSGLDAQQAARFQTLSSELRCLVCQNQNIADSNAPLAGDLRDQVKAQILAGRSDTEITHYLTDRYGDFVLYKPPFKLITLLLWLGPLALVLLALGIAMMFVRRSRRVSAPAAVNQEKLKRLLDGNP